ncbi:leucine rich repeat protein, partial [Coemansia spiralis]
ALAIIREAVEVGDAHIDLSDLQLEQVPDELAELKDLVVLAPSQTLVTDLQLTLSANRLQHFPLAVCELTNLTTLILSHNRIVHLPPEIGNLASLRELSVAHNRLRVLPLELTRLTCLQTLSVFPN